MFDDLQQQNKKDFCNPSPKLNSQCAEQQIWLARFSNFAIMTS